MSIIAIMIPVAGHFGIGRSVTAALNLPVGVSYF